MSIAREQQLTQTLPKRSQRTIEILTSIAELRNRWHPSELADIKLKELGLALLADKPARDYILSNIDVQDKLIRGEGQYLASPNELDTLADQFAMLDLRDLFTSADFQHASTGPTTAALWFIRVFELLRNVGVLVPLLVTWRGLSKAAATYQSLIASGAASEFDSFLLVWEREITPSFSKIARTDFWIILVLVVATFLIHILKDFVLKLREDELTSSLDTILWRASQVFAQRRVDLTTGAMTNFVSEFSAHASSLTQALQAEHGRIKVIADKREREIKRLEEFSSNLVEGTAKINGAGVAITQLLAEMKQTQQLLAENAEALHQIQKRGRDGDLKVAHEMLSVVTDLNKATSALMNISAQLDQALLRDTQSVANMVDSARLTSEMANDLLVRYEEVNTLLQNAYSQSETRFDALDAQFKNVDIALSQAALALMDFSDVWKATNATVLRFTDRVLELERIAGANHPDTKPSYYDHSANTAEPAAEADSAHGDISVERRPIE